MYPTLVSVPEAARRLSVSRATVSRMLAANELPHILIRGRRCIRIPVEALDQFLKDRMQSTSKAEDADKIEASHL